MSRYDDAVKLWAANQPVSSRYYDSRVERHLSGKDGCRLDPDSVEQVSFEAAESGGCETCSYTYVAITFRASCACGKVKDKFVEMDNGHKELPELIAEIMQYEPVQIEESPI